MVNFSIDAPSSTGYNNAIIYRTVSAYACVYVCCFLGVDSACELKLRQFQEFESARARPFLPY